MPAEQLLDRGAIWQRTAVTLYPVYSRRLDLAGGAAYIGFVVLLLHRDLLDQRVFAGTNVRAHGQGLRVSHGAPVMIPTTP